MGELAVTTAGGEELVALGLGSCIGLAIVDRRTAVCGLAHIVLPESGGSTALTPARFADLGVPALIEQVVAAGGRAPLLEAVMAGGASMFGGSDGLDVGGRNDASVRALLIEHGVKLVAHETGGNRGRTVKATADGPSVTVREAGADERELFPESRYARAPERSLEAEAAA